MNERGGPEAHLGRRPGPIPASVSGRSVQLVERPGQGSDLRDSLGHADELQVGRRHIGDVKTLRHRDHRGVDVAEWCRDHVADELGGSPSIGLCGVHDLVVAGGQLFEQGRFKEGAAPDVVPQEVARLTEDRFGDDQAARPGSEHPDTPAVMGVSSIAGGDQWA